MYVHLMEIYMYTLLSCLFVFCIRSTSVFTRTHRISNDAEYAPAWRYMYCGSLQLKAPPIVPVKPAEVNATMRKLQEGKVLGRAVIKFWDTHSFFFTAIKTCQLSQKLVKTGGFIKTLLGLLIDAVLVEFTDEYTLWYLHALLGICFDDFWP